MSASDACRNSSYGWATLPAPKSIVASALLATMLDGGAIVSLGIDSSVPEEVPGVDGSGAVPEFDVPELEVSTVLVAGELVSDAPVVDDDVSDVALVALVVVGEEDFEEPQA